MLDDNLLMEIRRNERRGFANFVRELQLELPDIVEKLDDLVEVKTHGWIRHTPSR